MSHITIYKIVPNGDVVKHSEARNGNAFAPLVWEHFGKKLNLLNNQDILNKYDKLWNAWPIPELSRTDNILIGATFDGAWLTYALIPDFIWACERFYDENVKGKCDERAFVGVIDSLKQIYNDPTNRGVAFNWHSVSPSFWAIRDVHIGDDEYDDRDYNIDHDKEHPTRGEYADAEAWELSEELGRQEKARREAADERSTRLAKGEDNVPKPNQGILDARPDWMRTSARSSKPNYQNMPAHRHYSQKCDTCLKCPRCSNNNGRNGSVQLTFWTPAGPWSMFLCGDCAKVVRKALNLDDDIFAGESDAAH